METNLIVVYQYCDKKTNYEFYSSMSLITFTACGAEILYVYEWGRHEKWERAINA